MFVLLLAVALALPSLCLNAGPYDLAICPIISGRFIVMEDQLWVEIAKQDGKPVEVRREKIANPPDDHAHEVLARRGPVRVAVHQDKKGGVFVHWKTLKDDQ